MADYVPNFGRSEGMIGPVGLWKYVDREGLLDISLNVARGRTLRTYRPTSRDQHWSLSWTLGKAGSGHDVQRRVHIVRESGRNHLTNWGPITVAIGNATISEEVAVNIGRVGLKERLGIEEIAKKTPVRKPNGDWNCQNWLETVLMEAVAKGLLPREGVQNALMRARAVQPIPFPR